MFIYQYFVIFLTAILAENLLFGRGLDILKMYDLIKNSRQILAFGIIMTGGTTAAAMLSYPLQHLIKGLSYQAILRPTIYLLCIAVVYIAAVRLFSKYLPQKMMVYGHLFKYAAFNCAALGALLVSTKTVYHFFEMVLYSAGTGIGFTLALLVVMIGKKALRFCDTPKVFRGLPILLLYLGIVSLAIYGLVGHQLPT